MLRALFRLILILVVLVAAFVFFTGYRFGRVPADDGAVGTAGRLGPIDADSARARGAQAGEAIAEGANKVGAAASTVAARGSEVLGDASITAKITSKMALDESVRALAIDVDTVNGIVTLSGRVATAAARQRAIALAKETSGVRDVRDRLEVR